jgi:hypothetical protein
MRRMFELPPWRMPAHFGGTELPLRMHPFFSRNGSDCERAAPTQYGPMTWARATFWLAQEFHRGGLRDWRLPTTHVTTADGSCDYSITGGTSCGDNPLSDKDNGSEMAHLFYKSLGNKSWLVPGTTDPQAGAGLSNTGDFQHLTSTYYWSGTLYARNAMMVWRFGFGDGGQSLLNQQWVSYALPVHPGDVGTAMPVPEPQTWALMLAGLAGVLLARRRRAL